MPKRQPIEAWLERPELQPSTSGDTVIEMEPLPPGDSKLDIFVIHRRAKPSTSVANPDEAIPVPYRDMDIIGRVPSPSISEPSLVTLDLDFLTDPHQNDGEQEIPSIGSGTFGNEVCNETREHPPRLTWGEEGLVQEDKEQQRKVFWTRIYLLMTLRVMFYLGMTPGHQESRTYQCKGKWFICMAIRFSIFGMALLQSVAFLKLTFLWGTDDGKLNYFITMGYAGLSGLKRVIFWGTLWWFADDIFKLLQSMVKLCQTEPAGSNITKAVFVSMIGSSIGGAIAAPFITFLSYVNDMDFLQSLSFDMSVFLCAWEVDFDFDSHKAMYGHNVTATTVTMAAFEASIEITGHLQQNVIDDVGLSISLTILNLTATLKEMLKADQTQDMNSAKTVEHRTNIWRKYRDIRSAAKLLNRLFGPLLVVLHLDNLLFFAYFLFDSIVGGAHIYIILKQVIVLIKVTCFYAVAVKAYEINADLKEWITATYCITDVVYVENGVNVLAMAALYVLSMEPIGVGSGMFMITNEFFAKFYGGVGSCFLLVYDFAKNPLMPAVK